MKSSSFKLLDGKWAEWEEREAENRCDKGQQGWQEQTILHVQRGGNITNQRATLGRDSVLFNISSALGLKLQDASVPHSHSGD